MERSERESNIEIAAKGASFVLDATGGAFVEFLKREDMAPLRAGFTHLAQTLARNKLLAKGSDGWKIEMSAVAAQPDRVLADLGEATRKVVGHVLEHEKEATLRSAGFHGLVMQAAALRPLFPQGAVALPADRLPPSLQLLSLHPLEIRDRDVRQFSGNDRVGSNMFAADVMWGDSITEKRLWDCNEIPYMLAKTQSPSRRQEIISLYDRTYAAGVKRGLPHEAAVEGGAKAVKVRCKGLEIGPDGTPGWTTGGSIAVMKELVDDKFIRTEKCARWLLETGTGKIEEGNNWGDIFWGVSLRDFPNRNIRAGEGRNELGKMEVARRDDLREMLGMERVFRDEKDAPVVPRSPRGFER